MEKKRALYLLNEGYKAGERDIALVHGTSTATVMEIMKIDKLPAGALRKSAGYIYFYPIREHMRNFDFYDSLKKSLGIKLAEDLAAAVAGVNECYMYFNKLFGFPHWEIPSFGEMQYGDIRNKEDLWKIIVKIKAQDRIDKSKLSDILKKSRESNGVVLGINKEILTGEAVKIEIDPDEYSVPNGNKLAVRMFLPNGLDEKYLQYIFPLGRREEEELRNFIEQNLK